MLCPEDLEDEGYWNEAVVALTKSTDFVVEVCLDRKIVEVRAMEWMQLAFLLEKRVQKWWKLRRPLFWGHTFSAAYAP